MTESPRHRAAKARSDKPVSRVALPQGLTVVMLLAIAAVALTGFSSAQFVSSSVTTGTVNSAADWTPPTVAIASPGSPVKGTTTLSATASDAETGIKNVAIQYQAAEGAGWTTVCTDTTAPFECSWDTKAVADGAYDLRAVATDNSALTSTSTTTRTTVANSLVISLASPGDFIRGTRTLSSTISGAGTLTPQVRVEYAAAGSTSWTVACTVAATPYDCAWNTTAVAAGAYDLRSIATSGDSTYISATVRTYVDNVAPTVSMTDPGSPLTGVKTFTATATDAQSGVAQVTIQYNGGTGWNDLCVVKSSPYSCSFDTSTLAGGSYSFRAVAVDRAGSSPTSATITNRTVSNAVSTVTLADPGAYLRGNVTLSATATSTGTIASVKLQRSPAGSATWTDICTDTSAPWTCQLATAGLTDGAYDLRAVLTDGAGAVTTSAVVTSRIVDNTPGRGVDVQTTNGTGTAGRIDAGDTMTFTYNERISPTSLKPGWDGSATPVSIRVRDGLLISLNPNNDVLDVTGVNLGSVSLDENFVATLSTLTVDATMTATTETVGGVARTVVTLRITSTATAGLTAGSAGTMVWTPSASATDLAGNPTATTATSETGTADRDF